MAIDESAMPDPAANRRWPLTTLMGNGPRIRMINELVRARHALAITELADRADTDPETVREEIRTLKQFAIATEIKTGMYRLQAGSPVVSPIRDLDDLIHIRFHPDSYLAEVLDDDLDP